MHTGSLARMRVAIRGSAQRIYFSEAEGAHSLDLEVGSREGIFNVHIKDRRSLDLERLADAELLFQGVCTTVFNTRGELTGYFIRLSAAYQMQVITPAYDTEAVTLAIRGHGYGFKPSEAPGPHRSHFGLVGFKERAARISGQMDIHSSLGCGTTISISAPVIHPTSSARVKAATTE